MCIVRRQELIILFEDSISWQKKIYIAHTSVVVVVVVIGNPFVKFYQSTKQGLGKTIDTHTYF